MAMMKHIASMKSRPRKPRKRFLFDLVVINMECYVVTCSDGNPYDIGVFMTFESLKNYFKNKKNWKLSDSITLEELQNRCDRVWIDVRKMKVYA